MKRLLGVMLCCVMLLTTFISPIFAQGTEEATAAPKIFITISDPETGDVWEWNVQKSDIQLNTSYIPASASLTGEAMQNVEASINLGKYLAETLNGNPSVSTTLRDDITITTGLTYSANPANNTVRLYSVFGSTIDTGYYYACERTVYWRNPGAGIGSGGPINIDTASWSFPTDSTPGAFSSSLPPYSLLDCKVCIIGMTATRTISVLCQLDNI